MKEKEININESVEVLDLKNILVTRQWLYDFLGKSYYMEPSLEALKEIDNNIFVELTKNEEGKEETGAKILAEFFENIDELKEEDIKKIKREYNKLFIGPGSLEAPPWESVYLSRERIIFDEHTLAVREFYRKWNVNNKKINKEPDDHIGYELEFMSILTSKSLKALEENNIEEFKETIKGQSEFLEKHTLLWIDKLVSNIVEASEEDYFKGLALFTLEYVNMDKELLDDIINNFKLL